MPERQYYREHRERLLAETRAWKEANPDRARLHNREYMRRAAVRRRALEKRRERGRAWYAEHRQQERERARRFREEHPEKVREYRARFRERHPERAAEQGRRATQKWRDGRADAVRAKQRAVAERRREEDPDAFRRWYQANLEKQRERGREASRLRSRLKKLGLPPKRIQRVYANDRRENERVGEEFFGRRRTKPEIASLHQEAQRKFRRPPAAQLAVLQARQRIMNMSREELHEAGQQLQDQLRAAKTRDLARTFFPDVATRIALKHAARLRREIEQDSIARRLRGGEPYDVDGELKRRIRQAAAEQVIALASRSNDEDQMRRLVAASYPRKATPRAVAGTTPHRQRATPERGANRASDGTER